MRFYWRILMVAAAFSAVFAANLSVRGHGVQRPMAPVRPAAAGQAPIRPVVEDWTGPTRTATIWR